MRNRWYFVNVICVEQNVKQSRPFVINYSLSISMHISKENSFGFLLCYVLLCVIFFLFSLPNYIFNQTR